ncbi:MAG TPA: ABC-three component system protein [Methylomirabilota bacterium]|nr:ABC-three component system protein [Methylomirabilota bacterium]
MSAAGNRQKKYKHLRRKTIFGIKPLAHFREGEIALVGYLYCRFALNHINLTLFKINRSFWYYKWTKSEIVSTFDRVLGYVEVFRKEIIMSGEFSAQAQNQALGYLYQVRYALLLLMQTGFTDPEAQISIEYLDDIAFEKFGTPFELIQTKHHINSKASLTDSSTDLWRTLRVWSEAFLQGKLQTENLTLTLITTELASSNSATHKLRPHALGSRNVDEALATLLAVAQSSGSKVNGAAYKAFLDLNFDRQRALLTKVQILDGSPNILDVLKEIANFLRLSTREKYLQAVCRRLEGWWFDIVIKHLSSKSYNTISYNDLRIILNDIQEQFYEENLPIDFPEPLEVQEKDAKEDQRIFVEQLRLINARIKRIQKAISDYYRSSAQRSEWVRDGVLLTRELEQYENRLCDEWERRFEMMQENFCATLTEEEMQKDSL